MTSPCATAEKLRWWPTGMFFERTCTGERLLSTARYDGRDLVDSAALLPARQLSASISRSTWSCCFSQSQTSGHFFIGIRVSFYASVRIHPSQHLELSLQSASTSSQFANQRFQLRGNLIYFCAHVVYLRPFGGKLLRCGERDGELQQGLCKGGKCAPAVRRG